MTTAWNSCVCFGSLVMSMESLRVLPGQVVHAGSSHPDDRLVEVSLLYRSERFSSGKARCCSQGACSPEEGMSEWGCQNVDASGGDFKCLRKRGAVIVYWEVVQLIMLSSNPTGLDASRSKRCKSRAMT